MNLNFVRVDKDPLLRGREALTVLLQRERVDHVSTADGHVSALIDGGIRMVGFDPCPDDSWQISEQENRDIVRCATGEEHNLDVERVLFISSDHSESERVGSLLWRTRPGGSYLGDLIELVVITQTGEVLEYSWDVPSVRWKLMCTSKMPLLHKDSVVERACLGLDGECVYWLERGPELVVESDGSSSEDTDSSQSDDAHSYGSSSSDEQETGGGDRCLLRGMRPGTMLMRACCCKLTRGSHKPQKTGSIEELYDMSEILSTAPTTTYTEQSILVQNLALRRRTESSLVPASPGGAWVLFARSQQVRLAYVVSDMRVSRDREVWDVFCHHNAHAPQSAAAHGGGGGPHQHRHRAPLALSHEAEEGKPFLWGVEGGVARTLHQRSGHMLVLKRDGALLRYEARAGQSPLEKRVAGLGEDIGRRAVGLFGMGELVGVLTRDGSVCFYEAETGEVREEVTLPRKTDAERAFSGRYVSSGKLQWRSVDSIAAPVLRQAGGKWEYESAQSALLWLVGVGLWRLVGKVGAAERTGRSLSPKPLAQLISSAPKQGSFVEQEKLSLADLKAQEEDVWRDWGVAEGNVDNSEDKHDDEDAHLLEQLMFAVHRENVLKMIALCDEVLSRISEPVLLLAFLPEHQRRAFAHARKTKILETHAADEKERAAFGGAADSSAPAEREREREDREVARVADAGSKSSWEVARVMHLKPAQLLKAMCRRAGVVLGRNGVVSVAHTSSHPWNAGAMWGLARRLLYDVSPEHLIGFVDMVCARLLDERLVECGDKGSDTTRGQRGGSKQAEVPGAKQPDIRAKVCEAACSLLPRSSDDTVQRRTLDVSDVTNALRLRSVCKLLADQGRGLEGVRMLAEAGLWDDVLVSARAMHGREAGEKVVEAALQGLEGWCAEGAKGERGEREREIALETIASLSDDIVY